jgi:hypothetical protein
MSFVLLCVSLFENGPAVRLQAGSPKSNTPVKRPPGNPSKPDFQVGGLIGDKYKQLHGRGGPLGRPTSKELDAKEGKGRYQTFEHGAIGWTPSTGPKSVQALYTNNGHELVFEWGETAPFNYDFFIVRWDLNGRNVGQTDVKGKSRTGGRWTSPLKQEGRYRLVVEGADKLVSGSRSRQGWSNPLYVDFIPPGPDYSYRPPKKVGSTETSLKNQDRIYLTKVPPASSVSDSQARFDQRAATAILYNACQSLPSGMGEDYGVRVLARLAYPDYFSFDPVVRKRPPRQEAIESLLHQKIESKSGTTAPFPTKRTGDYDINLTFLTAVIYKYYHVLTPDARNHIVDLLNKRGPYDPEDAWPFKPLPIPESENHLMMIETARYLTNQLLYRRLGDVHCDNARNGMDEWMLKHLQGFLMNDFIEYNARPYQDYTMSALLNLYTFTSAHNRSSARVKVAAEMVLDYLMAKVAVSSNQSRRYVTYRRHADPDDHGTYNEPDFLGGPLVRMDPQNVFSMQLAGTTDMVREGWLPGQFSWEMQWAGLSDYRVPAAILDVMIEPSHRDFFQRFHHYADEAYASSPSYLISSGGHYATFAYAVAGKGKHDDIGLALPTSFMPTGQFTTANDLIRFAGAHEDEKRSNMGVAPDFACGLNAVIPNGYQSTAIGVDKNGHQTPGNLKIEPWTFIDQSIDSNRTGFYDRRHRTGYYLAVYHRDGFGFLEAYDTVVRPKLSFKDFIAGVLNRNGKASFQSSGGNSYVLTDGRTIEFSVAPDSVVHLAAEKPFFLKGSILNSELKSGVVTIKNPHLQQEIVLDFHDWKAPTRRESSTHSTAGRMAETEGKSPKRSGAKTK